jgi:hypothetical protein
MDDCSSAARWLSRCAVGQSRSEALTGIIGPRRACTISMISPLSMPWRQTDVTPRLLWPIAFGERQSFLDAQPGAPRDHDQPAQATASERLSSSHSARRGATASAAEWGRERGGIERSSRPAMFRA